MVKQNIGQRMRAETLQLIQSWIDDERIEKVKLARESGEEINKENIDLDTEAMLRKIILYIGATRKKAIEYLTDLGEIKRGFIY